MTPFPAPPACAPSTPKLPLTTVSDRGLCALSNPFGYCRRFVCSGMALTHPPSCLPSLGAALLSAPLAASRRHGTMETLTPAPLTRSAALPAFLATPSCRSVSNHVGCLAIATPRLRVQRFSDFALESQARRSSPPNRVRHPTDRPFALGCSPPRFAATQLPSATEFVAYSDTDFHRVDVAPSRAHDSRLKHAGMTDFGLAVAKTQQAAGNQPQAIEISLLQATQKDPEARRRPKG